MKITYEKIALAKKIVYLYFQLGELNANELCNTPLLPIAKNLSRKQLREDCKYLKNLLATVITVVILNY